MNYKKHATFVLIESLKSPIDMKKNLLSAFALTGIFSLVATVAMAAPPPPPTALPVDGGLTLVLAVCAGYGAKKIYDSRKK